MDKIIPRWEWRTFGSKFGVSEEKIQNHKLGNFKRSSEKYILSKNSNDNCKIRDDLMDIKRLKQVSAAIAQIDKEFAAAGVEGHPDQLVGMGGTVTSMGAVKHKMIKYDPDVIQGSTLTKADISEQIGDYSTRTIEQRKELPGLQPKRADVILTGACILDVITSRLGVDKLTISDRGLRHGLAFDLFQK